MGGVSSPRPTRRWRVQNLELPLGEGSERLRDIVVAHLGIDRQELVALRLVRKSLDLRGRRRGRAARWIVHVEVVLPARVRSARLARLKRSGKVAAAPAAASLLAPDRHEDFRGSRAPRIVVVGSGPGGTFAALTLALGGAEVTVLDRGAAIENRSSDLVGFHRRRVPDRESNLLFGEGGAGTFSDGKLYTRCDDPLEVPVLRELVDAGASEEILWDARAHIGTDRLHRILPALRERLRELGVTYAFGTRLDRLVPASGDPGRVQAVVTGSGELPCDALVLATGHSAEDTWRALAAQGVPFEAKPFQLGVRIEHPQELIDRGRYGEDPLAEELGAASYNLTCRAEKGQRGAHSFCMCPGGKIVASVNEPGRLCTNGMSNSSHSSPWANAAVVTTVGPADFGPEPFDGVEYRRSLEERFFVAGGGDYTAPAQRAPDFLEGRETSRPGKSSYTFGVCPGRIDALLEKRLYEPLCRALARFDRQIPGFAGERGLLVGIESRSSGPVRIPRERDSRRAVGFSNLLPVGEGAGYAGGIMSSALDGVHSALALLRGGL